MAAPDENVSSFHREPVGSSGCFQLAKVVLPGLSIATVDTAAANNQTSHRVLHAMDVVQRCTAAAVRGEAAAVIGGPGPGISGTGRRRASKPAPGLERGEVSFHPSAISALRQVLYLGRRCSGVSAIVKVSPRVNKTDGWEAC